jgi:uncharacterized damage-inducible protein DinB
LELLAHYRRLFDYDHWANRETLASLRTAGPGAPERALQLMAHIVASGWLWHDRLQQQKQRMAVWPELSLDDCDGQLPELCRTWKGYLAGLAAETLSQPVAYTNTKGQQWSSTVTDVLTHVAMHAGYHRAQIAAHLRAAGYTPAYTDFIHATRQGFIK